MLARRALTRAEVESRLLARSDEAISAAAMERLERLRVLDDEALALRLAEDALVRRSLGRYRIRTELLRRGIAEELADRTIAEVVNEEGERESAALVLARFRTARGRRDRAGDPDERRKGASAAYRHLVGRGFPAGLVRDLLGLSL